MSQVQKQLFGSLDYSLEEKVVGTWIDGKPLYQKTFVFDGLITKTIPLNISNYEKCISFDGYIRTLDSSCYEPLPTNSGSTGSAAYVRVQIYNGNISLAVVGYSSDAWVNGGGGITLLYTKTTDSV